jgi:hypothetical protein
MRLVLRAYIRLSVRLLALENALTVEERKAIASVARELETQFGPSQEQRDTPTDPLLARLHEATFAADWEVS